MTESVPTGSARPKLIGEVLFDRFPDGIEALGGAPFNVAWHLQGFGANPLFVSCVGNDAAGERVRRAMDEWGMDVAGLRTDPGHPTGAVDIRFRGEQHSFEILPNQAYDWISREQLESAVLNNETALIYLGTLIMRTEETRRALARLLDDSAALLFVDINLREGHWREEDLPWLLQRSSWTKVNDEELDIMADKLGLSGTDHDGKGRSLLASYSLDLLILTLGSRGARALRAGADPVDVRPEQNGNVVDTIGAGDAFASVSLLGLLREWPLATILRRAQQFASRIVQQRGATSPNRQLYSEMKKDWGLT